MDQSKILEKVALLKEKADCFEYLPVANPDEVASFENKFGIVVPEDLKWFVMNVANGIKNNINPVAHVIDNIDFVKYYSEEDAYNPSIPFPFTKRVYFGDQEDDRLPFGPIDTTYDPDCQLFHGYNNGYIEICGYGCGAVDVIVVNGAEYGNIWGDNYSSNSEIFPLEDTEKNVKRYDFERWINKKLDDAVLRWSTEIREAYRIERLQKQKTVISPIVPTPRPLYQPPPKISTWMKFRNLFGL